MEETLTLPPPLKGATSRRTSAGSPIHGDCVRSVREIGKGAEGKFREVDGRDMLGCFGVLPVEFRHEPLCAFDIIRWSPFVFLYAVSFPMYEVFDSIGHELAGGRHREGLRA